MRPFRIPALALSLALESLGASPPPPDKLAPGDLLLVVDPNEMRIFTAELGRRASS